MKLIKNIKGFKFKITYNKLKSKFILDAPSANNIEFKNIGDVKRFILNSYPRFISRNFNKLEDKLNGN